MSRDGDAPATTTEESHGMSIPPEVRLNQTRLLPILTVNKYDYLNKFTGINYTEWI